MLPKSGSKLLKAAAKTLLDDGAGEIAAVGEAAEARKDCLEKIAVLRARLREAAEAAARPAADPAEWADRLEKAAAEAIAAAEAAAAYQAAKRKTAAEEDAAIANELAEVTDGLAEVAEELAGMASGWVNDLPDRRRRRRRLKAITNYIAVFRQRENH